MAIKQISVFMENKPGQLAELTNILYNAGINLRALTIAETAEYGVLRIIVDDCDKACKAITDSGHVVSTSDVLAVAVPDKPGGLFELLNILAKAEIDIEYMYSIFGHRNETAYMIFKADDTNNAEKLLKENDIACISAETVGIH